MIPPDIMTYIIGGLLTLLGALGLYTRGQHHEIKRLDGEVKIAQEKEKAARKAAQVNLAKARMHKDVAKTITQNSTAEKQKEKQLQEQIDGIKDGEEFTLII